MAEKETIPATVRVMTDAEVLEAQLVENLQRRDVHPMEEAQGFKALLDLDEPKYSIEQLAAKTGFIAERLVSLINENRLVAVARQHDIKKAKDNDSIGKLFVAYLRRAEESVLGSVLVQLSLVLAAARQNGANVLRDAATLYKVDADAIALKVKQEFAAKDKAKAAKKPVTKDQSKTAKKTKAA